MLLRIEFHHSVVNTVKARSRANLRRPNRSSNVRAQDIIAWQALETTSVAVCFPRSCLTNDPLPVAFYLRKSATPEPSSGKTWKWVHFQPFGIRDHGLIFLSDRVNWHLIGLCKSYRFINFLEHVHSGLLFGVVFS